MSSGINQQCVGPESEQAGRASSCQGCSNQGMCASAPKGPDPDVKEVQKRLAGVKHTVLVLSGKGGVGKSTFSSQFSRALSGNAERECGLLDIDICGPSVPRMLGVEGHEIHKTASGWQPVYVADNLAVMSIGFMLESPDAAVIWRGPKKNGMIKQFLRDVAWGELDYLVIDTPPGTSDEHLSVAQYLKECNVDGAVVVTTPQELALLDVRKEINFCKKVGIPVLGVVENMAGFVCPNCQGESVIFKPSTGGAQRMAEEMGVAFLGSLPLDPRLARACDEGKDFVKTYPDSPAVKALQETVKNVLKAIEEK